MARKILFLVPYPLGESPSQRFRFEQYFHLLRQQGYEISVQSFLNSEGWRAFLSRGKSLAKAKALVNGFIKRMIALVKSLMYDFVFIHREATPIGPPFFEWILAKILRRKIIYDFDDAIWLTDRANESSVLKIAKWRSKVRGICGWSYKVSCGNEYLCDYAREFNPRVIYNPTTIDTTGVHNPALFPAIYYSQDKVRIGWTGSHSTLKYLTEVQDVLSQILKAHANVEFVVIADRKPDLPGVPLTFVPWNAETEIKDLMQFDIGIMPLPDDMWAKGKCGFKALQYMALERPAIASPVGVNIKIIDEGQTGFLCRTSSEWKEGLEKLIKDPQLRKAMGVKGRSKIVEHYSVAANSSTFLSLFE